MPILLVFLIVTVVLLFVLAGPFLARKIFPPPDIESEFSVMVSSSHGLAAGQRINIEDEIVEIVRVEGNKVIFKRTSKK